MVGLPDEAGDVPEELDALRGGHAQDLGVGAAFVGEADDAEGQVLARGFHGRIMHERGREIDRDVSISLDGFSGWGGWFSAVGRWDRVGGGVLIREGP